MQRRVRSALSRRARESMRPARSTNRTSRFSCFLRCPKQSISSRASSRLKRARQTRHKALSKRAQFAKASAVQSAKLQRKRRKRNWYRCTSKLRNLRRQSSQMCSLCCKGTFIDMLPESHQRRKPMNKTNTLLMSQSKLRKLQCRQTTSASPRSQAKSRS